MIIQYAKKGVEIEEQWRHGGSETLVHQRLILKVLIDAMVTSDAENREVNWFPCVKFYCVSPCLKIVLP